MNLFPDFPPRPEPRKPTRFADPEPRRQKMLLSGLGCAAGQLDLFDVDGQPASDLAKESQSEIRT